MKKINPAIWEHAGFYLVLLLILLLPALIIPFVVYDVLSQQKERKRFHQGYGLGKEQSWR